MRIFAAVLALALAAFPAAFGYAAVSPQADDCPHQSAAPATGHQGHHSPAEKAPLPSTPICCFLHGVSFAATPLPAMVEISASGELFQRAEQRFEGTDIEPALPPPRT